MTGKPVYAPVALTIAGSDSGGGAGIQADFRAFATFGVFGTTAISALTAQNPAGVTGIQPAQPDILAKQIRAVAEAFAVNAVKTGMLFSKRLIEVVADELTRLSAAALIVDPVMVATSGARLLEEDAVSSLMRDLLPKAVLITPNIPEAEILSGRRVSGEDDMIEAGRALADECRCAVLVKGGHRAEGCAVDILIDDTHVWRLSSPAVDARSTHGTGCSLSAACAAAIAADPGARLIEVVQRAKAYVLASLRRCRRVGPSTWAMGPVSELPVQDIVSTAVR